MVSCKASAGSALLQMPPQKGEHLSKGVCHHRVIGTTIEAVTATADRQQLMLHTCASELLRHHYRLLVRHIRVRITVKQEGGRIVRRHVPHRTVWLEGSRRLGGDMAGDFTGPEAVLAAVEVEPAACSADGPRRTRQLGTSDGRVRFLLGG